MNELVAWSGLVAPWVYGGILMLLRLGTCFATMPDFGTGQVPGRIRLLFALALTIAMDSALGLVSVPLPAAPFVIITAAAREVVIGAALGTAVRLITAAAQMAGDLVGLSMGLSLATLFDTTAGEAPLATGRLFSLVAGLMFFAFGGHLIIVETLFHHFRLFPVGVGELMLPSLDALAGALTHIVHAAVLMAAPVLVVALLLNVAIGFVMRVVPSVNIFSIGIGILMLGGFAVLGLAGDTLMMFVDHEVRALPERMFQLSGGGP